MAFNVASYDFLALRSFSRMAWLLIERETNASI